MPTPIPSLTNFLPLYLSQEVEHAPPMLIPKEKNYPDQMHIIQDSILRLLYLEDSSDLETILYVSIYASYSAMIFLNMYFF